MSYDYRYEMTYTRLETRTKESGTKANQYYGNSKGVMKVNRVFYTILSMKESSFFTRTRKIVIYS